MCAVDITARVGLGSNTRVAISVRIAKQNDASGEGTVTVSGTQDGVVIYKQSQAVVLSPMKECQAFTFPDYLPTQSGRIRWAVEVLDGNSDRDYKTTNTRVISPKGN